MTIVTPKLSPGKGGWSKSERKRALRRYQLNAAGAYKDAINRRDGSQGAASPVRKIDPVTGKVIALSLGVPSRTSQPGGARERPYHPMQDFKF
jgi:hypothetical protein